MADKYACLVAPELAEDKPAALSYLRWHAERQGYEILGEDIEVQHSTSREVTIDDVTYPSMSLARIAAPARPLSNRTPS